LQDAGLDTIEANMVLGFENDERDYSVAGRLLELLGFRRILLLTNNPDKAAGLEGTGVEVCGSIPLQAPVTSRNQRYLRTMAERAGHRLRFSDECAPDMDEYEGGDHICAPVNAGPIGPDGVPFVPNPKQDR
jgi:hypothetical protein